MSFEEYLNIFYLKFFVFTRMNCQVSNTCLPTNCLLFGTTWVHPLISLWDYLSSPPDFTSGLLEFTPWFQRGSCCSLLFSEVLRVLITDYSFGIFYLALYCIVLYCIVYPSIYGFWLSSCIFKLFLITNDK